jgi:hypothetical protein
MYLNNTYIEVHIGSNLLDTLFPNQNGLKQGDTSSVLLFNFALKYALRKIPRKLGMTGTEWNTSAPGLC